MESYKSRGNYCLDYTWSYQYQKSITALDTDSFGPFFEIHPKACGYRRTATMSADPSLVNKIVPTTLDPMSCVDVAARILISV
jgi:hypothetical protein